MEKMLSISFRRRKNTPMFGFRVNCLALAITVSTTLGNSVFLSGFLSMSSGACFFLGVF